MSPEMLPPTAEKHPIVRQFHGDEFVDDYEWLRDKDDPRVVAHLEAENAFTEDRTAHLGTLREAIFADISARTQQTDLSVPALDEHTGGDRWWYYSRTVEGSDYPIFCRVPDADGRRPDPDSVGDREQVLLDGNAEAAGHEFFSLGALSVSPDGRLLAWSVDHAGDERFSLFVRDLATGEDFGPVQSGIVHGVTWGGDRHLFYSRCDEAWRPHQVWRHELGTDPEADVLVITEPDERFWLGVDVSRDRSQLLFVAGSKLTSEVWLLPTSDPTGTPRSVAGRTEGIEYSVEVAGEELFILHDANDPDHELAAAPLSSTSREQWTTIVPAAPGVRLESVDAYAHHLVLTGRRDGLAAVAVLERGGDGSVSAPRWTSFDEEVHEVDAWSEHLWEASTVRLSYTSLVTPASVLDLDLASGGTTVVKQTPVLDHPTHGAYRPEDYRQLRLWATAEDGTKVPISLVHHKDVAPDGKAPLLLYGYGSYEISIPPAFVISRLSLLDRGIVFAIAHVRGGGELGRAWYDNGKQLAKPNTFGDFVACARHLVDQGWTSPDRLAAEGRSAGGLLMGAITNLAPELFRAVHAGVPFVDALNTILKPELPLTVGEWEEWGNPIEDEQVYRCMKSYTPYENITSRPYPAILATTSLNDTRVFFTEPAKWVAKLRETVEPTPGREILLRTEMVAGHAGVSGRYDSWRERAFELAWIIDQIVPEVG